MSMMIFGRRLRAARIATGFVDPADFAESLGIDHARYQQFEAGTSDPTIHELRTIGMVTGKSIDFLVTGRLAGEAVAA